MISLSPVMQVVSPLMFTNEEIPEEDVAVDFRLTIWMSVSGRLVITAVQRSISKRF